MPDLFDKPNEAAENAKVEIPSSPHVVFDIETMPIFGDSIDDAKAYCEPLGIAFDPDSVALGNLKDKDKIAAKIESERSAFWPKIISKAALSPVTGKVLAIGRSYEGKTIVMDDEENVLLMRFWLCFDRAREDGCSLIGWNIKKFDIPFIMLRSAHRGVEIPKGLFRGRWLCDTFIDLMEIWGEMHSPWKQRQGFESAKNAAKFFGLSRPAGEIEGKEFWRFWIGDADERKLAERYLWNDVYEETVIASRLGVL